MLHRNIIKPLPVTYQTPKVITYVNFSTKLFLWLCLHFVQLTFFTRNGVVYILFRNDRAGFNKNPPVVLFVRTVHDTTWIDPFETQGKQQRARAPERTGVGQRRAQRGQKIRGNASLAGVRGIVGVFGGADFVHRVVAVRAGEVAGQGVQRRAGGQRCQGHLGSLAVDASTGCGHRDVLVVLVVYPTTNNA